jgi:hypothetical protein
MTRRYERYVYECCKASTLQKVSTQENLVWQTVNALYQQNARQELDQRPPSKISEIGMDEFAIKTVKRMGYGFRNFVNFKQRVLISFT